MTSHSDKVDRAAAETAQVPYDVVALNQKAKLADDAEHHESIWQSVKTHRLALFWALIVSMCVIM
jgi:hypothetical protein